MYQSTLKAILICFHQEVRYITYLKWFMIEQIRKIRNTNGGQRKNDKTETNDPATNMVL